MAAIFRKAANELRRILDEPASGPSLANLIVADLLAQGCLKKAKSQAAQAILETRLAHMAESREKLLRNVIGISECAAKGYDRLARSQSSLREAQELFHGIEVMARDGVIPLPEKRASATAIQSPKAL